MIRATAVVRRPEVAASAVAGALTLDHGDRHRRRLAMRTDEGLDFLLDLDAAAILDDGDAVRLEDGRLIRIRAARERVLEIRAATPLALKKLIWHIGNRHVPAEIAEHAVYIADDHVLAAMIRGLGGMATPMERPFRPERGAYDGGHRHG